MSLIAGATLTADRDRGWVFPALRWPRIPPLRQLQVSPFVDKKGIHVALRAAACARDPGAAIELMLAGSGTLKPSIRPLISEIGLDPSVELPGFVSHDRFPGMLGRAHLFIQPSRTAADANTEGVHPTTLLEAQAQCVPVIGTRHADLLFAVEHGKTGWLVAKNDQESLADILTTLATDRDRQRQWGEAVRPRSLRRHDPERLVRLRERICRQVSCASVGHLGWDNRA